MRQILKECKKVEEQFSEIGVEECKAGIRKWRETMSILSSWRHLGVCKCLAKQGEQKEEKKHILQTLTECASRENDSKACYNRMVSSLILLVISSLGMIRTVC